MSSNLPDQEFENLSSQMPPNERIGQGRRYISRDNGRKPNVGKKQQIIESIARGARIRTGDLLRPRQARYQAAPRPVGWADTYSANIARRCPAGKPATRLCLFFLASQRRVRRRQPWKQLWSPNLERLSCSFVFFDEIQRSICIRSNSAYSISPRINHYTSMAGARLEVCRPGTGYARCLTREPLRHS